jgi:hypothetical protein
VDVEEIISGLEELDRAQLARVEAALARRLRALGAKAPIGEDEEGRHVSGVLAYRPHEDGTLQKEIRTYYKRSKRRGQRVAHLPLARARRQGHGNPGQLGRRRHRVGRRRAHQEGRHLRAVRRTGSKTDEKGIATFEGDAKVAYFKDPDGHTLSIAQPPHS